MSRDELLHYLSLGLKNEKVDVNSLLAVFTPSDLAEKLLEFLGSDDAFISFKAANGIEQLIAKKEININAYKSPLLTLLQHPPKKLPFQYPLFVGQLDLHNTDLGKAWKILSDWVQVNHPSRIFRVNCLQALYNLKTPELQHDFELIVESLQHIPIASLQARMRILAKK